MAESGKWSCNRCIWNRPHQLKEKFENALQQIEDQNRKIRRLEEQLRGSVGGFKVSRWNIVPETA
jgi:Zn-finger protein